MVRPPSQFSGRKPRPRRRHGRDQPVRQQTEQLARGLRQRGAVDGDPGGHRGSFGVPEEFDQPAIPPADACDIQPDRAAGRDVGEAIGGKFGNAAGLRDPVAGKCEHVATLGWANLPRGRDFCANRRRQRDLFGSGNMLSPQCFERRRSGGDRRFMNACRDTADKPLRASLEPVVTIVVIQAT